MNDTKTNETIIGPEFSVIDEAVSNLKKLSGDAFMGPYIDEIRFCSEDIEVDGKDELETKCLAILDDFDPIMTPPSRDPSEIVSDVCDLLVDSTGDLACDPYFIDFTLENAKSNPDFTGDKKTTTNYHKVVCRVWVLDFIPDLIRKHNKKVKKAWLDVERGQLPE